MDLEISTMRWLNKEILTWNLIARHSLVSYSKYTTITYERNFENYVDLAQSAGAAEYTDCIFAER